MSRRSKLFTVFDVMEEKGLFEANPANAQSPEHAAAVTARTFEYPKMLYHPEGEMRVTVPAEIITTPLGPKAVCEQRELIYQIVSDAKSERKLLELGWHDHPAKAMAAAGLEAPAMSSGERIMDLEEQIRRLQVELNSASAQELAGTKPVGAKVTTRTKVEVPA